MAAQTANTKKTGSWDLSLKVIKTGIVSWLIVFLFWGLGSLQYDEIFLPSPAETWTAIKELVSNGTLWADIAASVSRGTERLGTGGSYCRTGRTGGRTFQTDPLDRRTDPEPVSFYPGHRTDLSVSDVVWCG